MPNRNHGLAEDAGAGAGAAHGDPAALRSRIASPRVPPRMWTSQWLPPLKMPLRVRSGQSIGGPGSRGALSKSITSTRWRPGLRRFPRSESVLSHLAGRGTTTISASWPPQAEESLKDAGLSSLFSGRPERGTIQPLSPPSATLLGHMQHDSWKLKGFAQRRRDGNSPRRNRHGPDSPMKPPEPRARNQRRRRLGKVARVGRVLVVRLIFGAGPARDALRHARDKPDDR